MAGMYDRFAKDASESLFNSIYADMYAAAEREQAAIYAARGKRGYHVGERQEALSAFCHGHLSIGDALDCLRVNAAYSR